MPAERKGPSIKPEKDSPYRLKSKDSGQGSNKAEQSSSTTKAPMNLFDKVIEKQPVRFLVSAKTETVYDTEGLNSRQIQFFEEEEINRMKEEN